MNVSARLEALLFVSAEPVRLEKVAKALRVSREQLEGVVEQLQTDYHNSPDRGLALVTHEGGVELVTRPECGEAVAEWLQLEDRETLSKAALETLAIIAYRGPITRSGIEAIRGVNCQMTLRNLLLRGFIGRRDEDEIRGYTYVLSAEALKHLGLSRKEELPEYEALSQDERLTALEATKEHEANIVSESPASQDASNEATEESGTSR